VGVYDTAQLPVDPIAVRSHRVLLKVPWSVLAKLTVPIGAGPPERSVTVARQVVARLAVTDPGAHVIPTDMGRTTVRNVRTVVSSLTKFASSACSVAASVGV
jgi:hypothetical protein